MNHINNARVCKHYLQFDESNLEHTKAKKLTDSYISTQDYDQALTVFLKLANNGDPFFQHNAGVLFQCIESVRDYDLAFHWFSASAQQNYAPAQERLGCMYEFGDGSVPVDMNTAMNLYRESAAQGNIFGLYNIGMLISEGKTNLKHNPETAEQLLIKAAKQGHGLMKLNLGLFYLEISKDEAKAQEWFTLAVEQDPLVTIDLGLWYLETAHNNMKHLQLSHFWLESAMTLGYKREVLITLGEDSANTPISLSHSNTYH